MNKNKELFIEILTNYSKTTFTEASRLKEDIKLDSLDLVELVMECEEKFGIEIPEQNLYSVSTVDDILKLIDSLVSSD
jgi:acyl carrier protein